MTDRLRGRGLSRRENVAEILFAFVTNLKRKKNCLENISKNMKSRDLPLKLMIEILKCLSYIYSHLCR